MKKIIIIMLQLILMVSLSACGSDSANNTAAENTPLDIVNHSQTVDLDRNSGVQVAQPEQVLAEDAIEKTKYGASKVQYTYHFGEDGVCNAMTTKLHFTSTDAAKQGYDKLSAEPMDEMSALKIEESSVSYIIPGTMIGKSVDEVKESITAEDLGYTAYEIVQ